MIQVYDLGKCYTTEDSLDVWAIKGVELQAKPGEILGLLGPNGAGKTTLLRILSTVLKPTQGSALVCGVDVCQQPDEVRKQIGFVSANTAVYERMTGWEFVEFFGQLYEIPKDVLSQRMNRLFTDFQMMDFKDQFCGKLSTGMRQKVSIARALIHDPPVLIFDEATLGLDIVAGRSVINVVRQLRDQGKCIIFSSHIMREVEKLCDRVAILYGGSIVAEGTQKQLIEKFEQPDLEELFFELISKPDPCGQRSSLVDGLEELV